MLTYYDFEQVKLLLAGEKKICDQIFDGVNFNKDQCFAEMTTNSVVTLLSFGDAVAKSKRSPEKLFVLLDMYEVMRELQSEVFRSNLLYLPPICLSCSFACRIHLWSFMLLHFPFKFYYDDFDEHYQNFSAVFV